MASFLDILVPSRVPDTRGTGRRAGPPDLETCIRYDIHVLLNARRPPDEFTDGFVHLPTSVINYGLKDYAFSDMKDREQRNEAARHIAEVIARFESRLTDIRVEVADPSDMDTKLHFRIFARLHGSRGESDFQNEFEWTTGHHEVTTV